MTPTEELAMLLEAARALPPMTAEERIVQAIDFAYGNLGCSTNHRVPLSMVAAAAWKREWRKAQELIEAHKIVENSFREQIESLREELAGARMAEQAARVLARAHGARGV